MHTTMLPAARRRSLLALLLGAVALLGAGCLPSAEDTLGTAPPGVLAEYDFSSGVPSAFSTSGTAPFSLATAGTNGGNSGPPSLILSYPTVAATPTTMCIELALGSISGTASWVEYYRLASWSGSAGFSVRAQPSNQSLETATASVSWGSVGFDLPANTTDVTWCIDAVTADGSTWVIELDDVQLY